MSPLSLIVAACFALTGILLSAIIIRVFYDALVGPQQGWSERWKIRQREKQLALLDQAIEKGEINLIFQQVRQSLFFDLIKHDQDLVERVSSLHFSVLNKLVNLSNSKGIHIPELMVLEDLFSSRTSLLRSWGEVSATKVSLMRKRNNKMPDWAFDEYQKKLTHFVDQLSTNRKSIESQLNKVFDSLRAKPIQSSSEEEIIYH